MLREPGGEGENCVVVWSSLDASRSSWEWGVQSRTTDSEKVWRVLSRRNRYATMQK